MSDAEVHMDVMFTKVLFASDDELIIGREKRWQSVNSARRLLPSVTMFLTLTERPAELGSPM